jgi:succinoglycan biosynthesis transport protein ExoP
MAVVLVAGFAINAVQPRLYTASSRIVIHPRAPRVLDKVAEVQDQTLSRGWGGLEQFYNTQQDIITGKAVARAVVESKGLAWDERWVGDLIDPLTGEAFTDVELTRRAISQLRRSTELLPSPKSQIFEIRVTDEDPDLATQVDAQRIELEESEEAIQEFVVEHDLQSLTIAAWRNQGAERVAELTSALDIKERNRVAAEAKLRNIEEWIEQGKRAESHPVIGEDPSVRLLSAEILLLERKITRDGERYGDRWPGQKADRDELALLRSSHNEQVAQAVEAVRVAYGQARGEERKLKRKIRKMDRRARKLGGYEVEYNRLRRVADSNAALYQDILRRSKETEIAQRSEASNVNILEYADVPRRPSHPNQLMSLLATLLATLGFGLGTAFVLENLDSTIKDASELDTFFNLWPLGVLPVMDESEERQLLVGDDIRTTAAAECLRSVRTNLLFLGTKRPMRKIVVTSAGPREGKTTLCANIAATMALAGHKVLLVDTDMRRPRIHSLFGMPNTAGIVDIMVGERSIEQCVKESDVSGLDVLVCGAPPANPAEMIGSRAFDKLMDRLAEQYDFVFLDSPPVLLVTDASVLSQKADGTLLVLRIGQTERRHFRHTLRSLEGVHVDVLGVVCNGVDLSRGGGSYGYGYGYGYDADDGDTDGASAPGRSKRRSGSGRA